MALLWHAFLIIFQKTDAFDKIRLCDQHYQINRIKIFLTTKASGQISCRINGRVKFVASGAKKGIDSSIFLNIQVVLFVHDEDRIMRRDGILRGYDHTHYHVEMTYGSQKGEIQSFLRTAVKRIQLFKNNYSAQKAFTTESFSQENKKSGKPPRML